MIRVFCDFEIARITVSRKIANIDRRIRPNHWSRARETGSKGAEKGRSLAEKCCIRKPANLNNHLSIIQKEVILFLYYLSFDPIPYSSFIYTQLGKEFHRNSPIFLA